MSIVGDGFSFESFKFPVGEIHVRISSINKKMVNIIFNFERSEEIVELLLVCAMKSTYGVVNGVPCNIFKNPKTDNGIKKSAKGLLAVEWPGILKEEVTWAEEGGMLETVFLDGKLIKDQYLSEIRKRLSETSPY